MFERVFPEGAPFFIIVDRISAIPLLRIEDTESKRLSVGNVFHKRYCIPRQPLPTSAVSEQKRGRSSEGTLPIRSFERDVCLRALGKCRQYCRDSDHPPQLFPDPTVCRVGKCRTVGCGNQDFRERLAHQS